MEDQNQSLKAKKYLLEPVVFICGAIVMIFELVGSRLLGPYMGTSIYVWTSLIGVILGSMSLGYWLGGKIADKKADYVGLAKIIFWSGVAIALNLILRDIVPQIFWLFQLNIEVSSLIVSVILFAPASVLLGMVSPYTVKLRMNDLNSSGSVVGNLYAISTLGSIIGTFSAGFFIIPFIGTKNILILLFLISMITAAAIFLLDQWDKIKKVFFIFSVLILLFGSGWLMLPKIDMQPLGINLVADVDTQYNRMWIFKSFYEGKETLNLMMDPGGIQSGMYLASDDLVFPYSKYFHLVRYFNPSFKSALMIGGGAYSFPKDFIKTYPEATIDVVEIDPKLLEISKEYFRLADNYRLKNYSEDGRVFLNQTKNKYDVIFSDAFGSDTSTPFQLTTKEVIQRQSDILNKDGVMIVNIASTISGEGSNFLRAEYATYKAIFPQVYLFPVEKLAGSNTIQNIMLVASKSDKVFDFKTKDKENADSLANLFKGEIKNDLPILTDDYCPVEYYKLKSLIL